MGAYRPWNCVILFTPATTGRVSRCSDQAQRTYPQGDRFTVQPIYHPHRNKNGSSGDATCKAIGSSFLLGTYGQVCLVLFTYRWMGTP